MNVKEFTQLTEYLNTLSEQERGSISIGACFDGYVFVEDYFGSSLDASKMIEMGYVYINSEKWWALKGELPC